MRYGYTIEKNGKLMTGTTKETENMFPQWATKEAAENFAKLFPGWRVVPFPKVFVE